MRLEEILTENRSSLTAAQIIRNDINSLEYDEVQPQYVDYDDTRRPRLTLRTLNKLRLKKDRDKLEKEEHLQFVHQMYGFPHNLPDELRVDLMKVKLNNLTDIELAKIDSKKG